jgi:hypothetical protein
MFSTTTTGFAFSQSNFVWALFLLYATSGFAATLQSSTHESKGRKMALIHIDLQEGFEGDTVLIRVNGEEVFRRPVVKTRLQIGLADSIQLELPAGLVNIEVALPLRKLSESKALQVSAAVYLGVSVTREGKISYRISKEPFGYM